MSNIQDTAASLTDEQLDSIARRPQPLTDLELFRSYFNDFLSVERFAEYYGLTIEHAQTSIALGRDEHNAIAAMPVPEPEQLIYAIYSVALVAGANPDNMKPESGTWTQTEGDDQYEYDYLADECNDERLRNGTHRKWVAELTVSEARALAEEMMITLGEGENTMGMLTGYGVIEAEAFNFDPMDWNMGGITDVVDAHLYIEPIE